MIPPAARSTQGASTCAGRGAAYAPSMPALNLARYRVVRRIGSGGVGEVFLADDGELDRPVALKIMSAEAAGDPIQRKRFRAEARAASALSHPNICATYEVGETSDGRPFIALEYVEGQTLDLARQQQRLAIPDIVEIGLQVAEALETAHARRLVHRDIKPTNLMLDRRGRVKVMDFGLAKQQAVDPTAPGGSSLLSTQTGIILGTPHYMSPEQALGHAVDHRTDLFSLGVVLYELVAWQKPFPGGTVGEAINNVVNRQPDPPSAVNRLCPAALEQIILRCLEKDRDRRYATAGELAEALRALKERLTAERAAASSPVAGAESPSASPATPASAPSRSPSEEATPAASVAGEGSRGRLAWRPIAVGVLVLGLGVLGWWGWRSSGSGKARVPSTGRQSIAVLPFDNFSGEPDTDYLSDGLTEEITAALSRIPGLKVASRNSAFVFKGRREDTRQIGAALHVETLLEGSVRMTGRQLRVTAQLISARDGFHLWSETYDRTVDDVIAVQEDIATRIAGRLQGAGGNTNLASRAAIRPEAHRLYLQARLFWNRRSVAGLQRAIQLFQDTLGLEPEYAAAHAGLASSYLILPMYSPEAQMEEYAPMARAAARRAIELDPGCAEAHAVLGNLAEGEWDLKGAEAHFQRAIQGDPNSATAHHWYGRFLNLHGRRDEGWRELQTALDLDPLSPVINTTIPEWHYMGGDFPRAITEAHAVIEQHADFQVVRRILIAALLLNGQPAEALTEIESARKLQPDDPFVLLGFRAYALARSGKETEAREILAGLERRHAEGKPVLAELVVACMGVRDFDRVFDLLEPHVAKEGLDSSTLCDPFEAEVRNQPRFQELLRKAKVPRPVEASAGP